MRRRRWLGVGAAIGLVLTLAYLRDPAWLADQSGGFRDWETDDHGTAFRWIAGHAWFFVPSDAATVEIPLKALFRTELTRPFVVRVTANDLQAVEVKLADEQWTTARVTLDPHATRGRRLVRIDIRVDHVWAGGTLGVEVGEIKHAGQR